MLGSPMVRNNKQRPGIATSEIRHRLKSSRQEKLIQEAFAFENDLTVAENLFVVTLPTYSRTWNPSLHGMAR